MKTKRSLSTPLCYIMLLNYLYSGRQLTRIELPHDRQEVHVIVGGGKIENYFIFIFSTSIVSSLTYFLF